MTIAAAVAAIPSVANAVTEAGKLAEQELALRNTPQMQQAAEAAVKEKQSAKIADDVNKEDTEAIQRDLAP